MERYTTGQIAKLCGVSVRTVQYYDSRNILIPSQLSEGGRRLYSQEDLEKMKIICFLRDLDLPLETIAKLMSEARPEDTIELLLQQHENKLRQELEACQDKLDKLQQLQRQMRSLEHISVESIGDIAYVMKNRKRLRRVHGGMLAVGIPLEILEWVTFIYAMKTQIWWPFLLGLCCVLAGAVWISIYYHRSVEYICPRCHRVFKPRFGKMFWASHTPTTRKLTCPECGQKSFCVEVCREEAKDCG